MPVIPTAAYVQKNAKYNAYCQVLSLLPSFKPNTWLIAYSSLYEVFEKKYSWY